MAEYEPDDSRIITGRPSKTPVEPKRTGPQEAQLDTARNRGGGASQGQAGTEEEARWQAGSPPAQSEGSHGHEPEESRPGSDKFGKQIVKPGESTNADAKSEVLHGGKIMKRPIMIAAAYVVLLIVFFTWGLLRTDIDEAAGEPAFMIGWPIAIVIVLVGIIHLGFILRKK